MRRLSKVVNIVPVIAKADTLTLEERDFFKKKGALPPPLALWKAHGPLPLGPFMEVCQSSRCCVLPAALAWSTLPRAGLQAMLSSL
ncbi:hypothetical protein JZ751_013283 [Albula glossodonta]|uniref:Septin-type G domain-containing protein n=1 Tax=Albula glossodonta TaxID=121402 RepID=A0A8T2NWL0_9TELE|nr:hypothetical protein JZ751_013283 [Albula glossodonta]